MRIYTVSFFGHRGEIEGLSEIEKRMNCFLREIVKKKEYVEFLIGRDGEFDLFTAASIKNAIHSLGYHNTSLVLVLPYFRSKNIESYREYYDEIEICAESENKYPKAAIQVRNRYLVDRSDLVVCCIQHRSGGAYQTVRYAQKKGKIILNLAEEDGLMHF